MPYGEIRPIDRSCGSYRPGHQVHWIQAKKSVEEEQPLIDVSVVVHRDGRVDIECDELNLTLWNHDPQRLQSAVDYWGRAVWKPRYHVLSLPGLFGYVFNLAALNGRTPCIAGRESGRSARRDRERRRPRCGLLRKTTALPAPLQSLRAQGVAEGHRVRVPKWGPMHTPLPNVCRSFTIVAVQGQNSPTVSMRTFRLQTLTVSIQLPVQPGW